MIADGSRHDPALTEAKGLAAARWNRLLNMEAQVRRDEQILAVRPKKRPSGQPGDDVLPDRTLAQRDAAWLDETKHKVAVLADLKAQVKRERAEVESYAVKSRR
jgi:hypothetical protein